MKLKRRASKRMIAIFTLLVLLVVMTATTTYAQDAQKDCPPMNLRDRPIDNSLLEVSPYLFQQARFIRFMEVFDAWLCHQGIDSEISESPTGWFVMSAALCGESSENVEDKENTDSSLSWIIFPPKFECVHSDWFTLADEELPDANWSVLWLHLDSSAEGLKVSAESSIFDIYKNDLQVQVEIAGDTLNCINLQIINASLYYPVELWCENSLLQTPLSLVEGVRVLAGFGNGEDGALRCAKHNSSLRTRTTYACVNEDP